jgi:hypothetical protein
MRTRTIIFLLIFVATAITAAVDIVGVTQRYVQPTLAPTLIVHDPIEMTELPVAGGSTFTYWTAESPEDIQTKSVLYGNVTLCCTTHATPFPPPPSLFILTSTQMASWKERDRDPREYMAVTSSANYSYSGPNGGVEALSFRVVADVSDVYHVVAYVPTSEKATLHLWVSGFYLAESLTVKLLIAVPPIVSLA